jgi:hypothetical protein
MRGFMDINHFMVLLACRQYESNESNETND